MQTELPPGLLATSRGRRANEILRSCVHCGFCNATCPTYQVLGDELDGPRGRIYLIKGMLETQSGYDTVATHLDRCLTCRACETTCPSGVAYGELLEIGREVLETNRRRPAFERLIRGALVWILTRPAVFRPLAKIGHRVRALLPRTLRDVLPVPRSRAREPDRTGETQSSRRVALLEGCVQQVATPETNSALARLLTANGIDVVSISEHCCGGLALHLGQTDAAHREMRKNVATIVERALGCQAILSTASGCGVTLKDYGRLLAEDSGWAGEARWVAERTLDVAEFVAAEALELRRDPRFARVAWQAPCTLRHGQRISGVVEGLLERAGYQLVSVSGEQECCGSAGSYAALQPGLARELRQRKLEGLMEDAPDVIATANVGCQAHLGTAAQVPVVHWLELVS